MSTARLERGAIPPRQPSARALFGRCFERTTQALTTFVALFAIFCAQTAIAAPVISSFSPTADPIGTTVTINGSGFSTTASIVKFNNIQVQTINSATTSKLVVLVPSGATTGKITVTVGTSTGQSTGVYTVTPPPTISSFSPSADPIGTPVTIIGTNFDTNVVANNIVKFHNTQATVTSATATQIVATVPTGATTGTITVSEGGATATSGSPYTVTPPPTITSFSPTKDPVGTPVTIVGTNFDATTLGNNVVRFHGTQATVTSATATQIVATVPTGATTGTITVSEGGATATSGSSYTVTPPPTITSFSPPNAAVGAAVTITGTNFDTTLINNIVRFNGTQATVNSATATQLGVTVPTGATSGKITVAEGGAMATSTNVFTVNLSPPTFTPTSGVYGTPVTITGTGFSSANPLDNTVKFNGSQATVTAATTTQLSVTVPSPATTGQVTVQVGTSIGTSASNFTVPSPTITSIPSGGAVGSQVTINGTNFSPVAGDNVVAFHGTAAVVTSSTPTQIVTSVPAGATSGTIKVTVGSHFVTSAASFTVTQTPSILGFLPTFGPSGTDVSISGANFSSNASNDAVTFNSVSAQINLASTTSLDVTAPPAATTGPIGVTANGASTASATNFTVVPGFSTRSGDVSSRPSIDAFSPTSGAPGTLVAIRSSALGVCCWQTVKLNGTPAQVVQASQSDLLVVVPSGATTGLISIAYSNGATSNSTSNFTVVPTAPVISDFSPRQAPVGATLTIVGSNFGTTIAANTVLINGATATVAEAAANQLAVTVPTGATSGVLKVTVNGITATSVVPFAVIAPASTILAIDGVSNAASTTAAGQSISFTFNAATGQNLGLAISNLALTPSTSLTTVTVTAPDSSPVATAPCAAGCTVELSNLPSTGTYTVTVNPNFGSTISAIATLSSQVTGSLVAGTASQLSLSHLGQIGRLSFSATAGDSYALDFSNLFVTPTEVVQFKVLGPNGSQVGSVSQSDGGKSVLPLVQLPTTGTYTVLVEPLNAAFSTSMQTLLAAPVSIPLGGTPVGQDTNLSGQTGLLKFSATAGQNLDLRIETNTSYNNGRVTPVLYSPTGTLVSGFFEPNYAFQAGSGFNYSPARVMGCNDYVGLCQLSITAPSSGTYVLYVGPASFNYEPGPAFATTLVAASAVSIAADATGHQLTFAANQTNRLSFNGTLGQNLQLQWGALSAYSGPPVGNAAATPSVTVLNPDGTPLTWFSLVTQDASQVSAVRAGVADLPALPTTGAYTVVVDLPPDSIGALSMTLTTIAAGACLEPDSTLVAQTTLVVSPKNVPVGSNYSVSATESDCNHTTGTIYVYDDIGNTCQINTASPTACSFPTTQAGSHLIAGIYGPSSGALFNSVSANSVVAEGGTSTVALQVTVTPDSYVPGAFVVSAIPTPNPPATAQPTGIIKVANCTLYLPNTQCFPVYFTGSTSFTAQYFGDANYAPATSSSVVYSNVPPLATTTSIVSAEPEPAAGGAPYEVRVLVSSAFIFGAQPTGTVTIGDGTYTTSGNPNTCTFNLPAEDSCRLSTRANGFVSLTASYSGDANFQPSQSLSYSHRVLILSQVSLAIANVALEPSAVGQSYSVATILTPIAPATETPTGTITITDGQNSCSFLLPANGCSIAQSSPGLVSLVAQYSGDVNYAGAVSSDITHSVSSPGGPGSLAPRHEICGFDANAAYPPPAGFVPVTQLPGFIPSPGLDASILGQPIVKILYPPPNATTYDTTVDVVGTIVGPINTGVTINGVVAPSVAGYFALPAVQLTPGANGITAKATTLTGLTSTAIASLTLASGPKSPAVIAISGPIQTAFAPFSPRFSYLIDSLSNNATVQSVKVDFGDGTAVFVGSAIADAPTNHSYKWPGLYSPTLTITDSNNQTYVSTTTVVAQDLIQQRGMLCDVYGYLKDRLNQVDPSGASLAFAPVAQAKFQSLFGQLNVSLPSAATMLGVIANGIIGQGYAEMALVRDNSNQTREGFPLRMTRGADGVWRVSEL